jgi:glutamyl/glutaminyl-tRNA synthetase
MSNIRVRFAPSPTGEMHVGNLRTAIFNWLFARINNGKFLMRIEDTDLERSKKLYEEKIFEILKWLNIDYDDDYFRQSERIDLYVNYAKELVKNGFAYYCICDEIDLRCNKCRETTNDNGVIRFKVQNDEIIQFKDIIFGDLSISSNQIEDFALVRSNGVPTYMLCVVIDDHLMNISHVIRGEDHRTNTFKQILIYKAFGFVIPEFAHLPMIKGNDGKKLSKRNGDVNVNFYKEKGIVSDAFLNILVKLGWGFANEEIISRERLFEIFKLSDVRKSPTLFDTKKLLSFSGYYLRNFDYSKQLIEFLSNIESNVDEDIIRKLYSEVVKRSSTFLECYEEMKFLWKDNLCESKFKIENVDLNQIESWTANNIESFFREKSNFKEITKQMRMLLTGKENSINLFLIMEVLGKEECIKRVH